MTSASRDLGKDPDGLAYFYYWLQPLNGPIGKVGGPITAPVVGPEANVKAFTDSAGSAFPRMANFSFEYGNAHWTVLDANATVDWTNAELKRMAHKRPGLRQGRDVAVRELPSAGLQFFQDPFQ